MTPTFKAFRIHEIDRQVQARLETLVLDDLAAADVGVRVAYASESVALAVLEILAGTGKTSLLSSYSLMSARFSASAVEVLAAGELPGNWRNYPPPPDTQRIGDRWIAECRSLVLRVPSAIIETESNFLLNPLHPAFTSIECSAPMPFDFDPRLVAAVRKR